MSEGSQQPEYNDHTKEGRAIKAGKELMAAFESLSAKHFFEKSLTSSDIAGTGRVVIPKVSRDDSRYFVEYNARQEEGRYVLPGSDGENHLNLHAGKHLHCDAVIT